MQRLTDSLHPRHAGYAGRWLGCAGAFVRVDVTCDRSTRTNRRESACRRKVVHPPG